MDLAGAQMDFGTNSQSCSHKSKENIPPSSKADAPQVRRAKQRTVLGVLSENKQHGPSHSQGSQFSKHSSMSDSSQLVFFVAPSSSDYDVYVEEAREVVLATSGQEVVSGGSDLGTETSALQNEGAQLLLGLSSSSCQDTSEESDEFLMSERVPRISDYTEDIHKHLRKSECQTTFRPNPDYLENHPQITDGMRVVLVDWLVEVVQEYRFRPETLHLAVNYLDRFLSRTVHVKRAKLQLAGAAALLLAAKFEEISPPELNEFVYLTDSTYTSEQLVRMEFVFLKALAFRMAAPTAHQFLHLFLSVHPVCVVTESLAMYVAELSLLEMDPFLRYMPSVVAAAAYTLAMYTVNRILWPPALHAFTGYAVKDILPCLTDLHKLHMSAESRPQQAIREKFKSSKYCHVSLISPPAVLLLT